MKPQHPERAPERLESAAGATGVVDELPSLDDVSLLSGAYPDRQRRMILRLRALVIRRDARETRSVEVFTRATTAANQDRDASVRQIEDDHRARMRKLESERTEVESEARGRFESVTADLQKTYRIQTGQAQERYDQAMAKAKKKRQDELWLAEAVYDGAKSKPRVAFENLQREVEGRFAQVDTLVGRARELVGLSARKAAESHTPDGARLLPGTGPKADVESATAVLHRSVERLAGHPLLALGRMSFAIVAPLVLAVVGAGVGFLVPAVREALGLDAALAAGVGGGAGLLLGLLLGFAQAVPAGAVSRRGLASVLDAEAAVRLGVERWLAAAAEERAKLDEEIKQKRASDMRAAEEEYRERSAQIEERDGRVLREAREQMDQKLSEHRGRLESDLSRLEEKYLASKEQIAARHERLLGEARARYESAQADAHAQRDADRQDIEREWHTGMAELTEAAQKMGAESTYFARSWSDAWWTTWKAPALTVPAIQAGDLRVDAGRFRDSKGHGGIPDELEEIAGYALCQTPPAVLDFPGRHGSFMIECPTGGMKGGRDLAIRTMQHVMLRMLTGIPPGKLRFTIIDPVGLGQSFAGFMHLADYEELLVTNRIWTEERHIEQRMLDLTEHMENVIQKYLRNEFGSIEEYNEHAGEIAEPYRILVISDFPTGWTEQSCRRLKNVAESGARCGVYTVLMTDPKNRAPGSITLDDLRKASLVIQPKADADPMDLRGYRVEDEQLRDLPLTLEAPPPDDAFRALVHRVGEQSRDANRVEVPFRKLYPPDGLWRASSSSEMRVAMGRSGATKLQEMALGRGTSQHVIIGGKTGSGKSTLLHVLITNACLWYSPDEVEFFLIDFKKGVEFKAYCSEELPHIRAVAIESEREFGLSVLMRLDEELTRRGDQFRAVGVQNVPGWREARPEEPMPRILLIIDEFQEFFVEDDKVSQEAGLLLDRLVRQGRAFGIHVILGSQTLAGAYSLARSTLGQMGVRIALQCNEADSYLILSEDNAAARLLSRPGEAIYNDANGMVEGNHPFQVAWLSDAARDDALDLVRARAVEEGRRPRTAQIVFEGNVAADLARNRLLDDVLAGRPTRVATAWLGEPVAIKDPTGAELRRQASNNVLCIGQRDELALGFTVSAVCSLAAQIASDPGARMVILNGIPDDDRDSRVLSSLSSLLPGRIEVGDWRSGPAMLGPVEQELLRREDANITESSPIFVFIHGLQKFRELRRKDEDFGFSFGGSSDEGGGEPRQTPDKSLAKILKDGSGYGVHAIVWCDTYTNLGRTLERSSQGEFESRIVFQMSAADSSALIDSAQAAKLGMQRALYYNEDQGVLEKYRPYGVPSAEWMESLRARLASMG